MKKILFVSTLTKPHVNMMNTYPPKLEFSEKTLIIGNLILITILDLNVYLIHQGNKMLEFVQSRYPFFLHIENEEDSSSKLNITMVILFVG